MTLAPPAPPLFPYTTLFRSQVDVGRPDPQQIVCGAWNFGPGATVAVGLPGALLPGFPGPLEERPLRGEVSRGMIRSEEHTSALQSPCNLVCRLLLETKKIHN